MPTLLLWIGLGLAVVTAIVYFIIASPARPAGYQSPPRTVMIMAGAAYVAGGLLILLGDPRLLIAGAIINALVLAAFSGAAVARRATLDGLSLAGKVAQIGLQVVLLLLIVRPGF